MERICILLASPISFKEQFEFKNSYTVLLVIELLYIILITGKHDFKYHWLTVYTTVISGYMLVQPHCLVLILFQFIPIGFYPVNVVLDFHLNHRCQTLTHVANLTGSVNIFGHTKQLLEVAHRG